MDYVIDVEATGPIPGDFSMTALGAIVLPTMESFGVKLKLLPDAGIDDSAVRASCIDLEECEQHGEHPATAMGQFDDWIKRTNTDGRPILWSDNNQFDGMYVAWYFHHFLHYNPFGYSSRRIGDLYCGHMGILTGRWKHLRDTPHTHNPVEDAMGNAEALTKIITMMRNKLGGGSGDAPAQHVYTCPMCKERVVAKMSPSEVRTAIGSSYRCPMCHAVMTYRGKISALSV